MTILSLLGCMIVLSAEVNAQKVVRPLYPASEEVCGAAWRANVGSATDLLQPIGECTKRCADQRVAMIGTGEYETVCGGDISVYDSNALAGYTDCLPAYLKKEAFWVEIKSAHEQCLAAVKNREAVEIVLNASGKDDDYPSELHSARDAAETLNSQVSTGNGVVDNYREEAQERAANAASSLQAKGLRELESLLDQQTAQYSAAASNLSSSVSASVAPSRDAAKEIRQGGQRSPDPAANTLETAVGHGRTQGPIPQADAARIEESTTRCGAQSPDISDLVKHTALGSHAAQMNERRSIQRVVSECGSLTACANAARAQILEYRRALAGTECQATSQHAQACDVLRLGIEANERWLNWVLCY